MEFWQNLDAWLFRICNHITSILKNLDFTKYLIINEIATVQANLWPSSCILMSIY